MKETGAFDDWEPRATSSRVADSFNETKDAKPSTQCKNLSSMRLSRATIGRWKVLPSASESRQPRGVRWLLFGGLFLLQSCVVGIIFENELDKHDYDITRQNASSEYKHQLLVDYGNATVYAFAKCADIIAVMLDNTTIIAYRVSLDKSASLPSTTEFWRRSIKPPLSVFYNFKLVDPFTLLYCTAQFCEACNLKKDVNISCTYFSLIATNNMTVANVQAWLVKENRLILRTVIADSAHNGALYALQPNPRKLSSESVDRNGVDDVAVVGVFATTRYTFFVGSASKIDVPHSIFTGDKMRRRRMDLRVTRVCNQDSTDQLESRIDIALSCDGLDGGDGYWNASPKRAKSASLSEDRARLHILFEQNTTTVHSAAEAMPIDAVCEFDVKALMKRFDDTWDVCQGITDSVELNKLCKEEKLDSETARDPRCYIFAWSRPARVPLCERFGADHGKVVNNCNLAALRTSVNRNYWLENYQPLMGRIVAKLTSNDAQQVFEGTSPDVIFIRRTDALDRLRKDNATANPPLWSTAMMSPLSTAVSTSPMAAIDNATNIVIFANKNELKYAHLTCQDLYPTCQLISWSDPLRCRWCADENGDGHTFSANDSQLCGKQSLDKCPPIITEVVYDRDRDRFMVVGDFRNVDNLKIKACDEECSFYKVGQIVYCYAQQSCTIELTGQVGSWIGFRLVYTKHLQEMTAGEFNYSLGNNSRLLRILVTIFVVFLLFTILVIIWQLYRKYADKIRLKMRQNAEKASKGKYMSVSTGEFGGLSLAACHRHIHEHAISSSISTHHPQMSFSGTATTTSTSNSVSAGAFVFGSGGNVVDDFGVFSLCDNAGGTLAAAGGPNRIDKSRIFLLKKIGDGNSSTVHLAKYAVSSDTNTARRVAVKTICNSAFDVEDVMREVELISRCRHKNIVEYIGHFEDAFSRMHIVTEYMAGGDLHNFLIGPSNKLTVGDAFLFILQICEGMEYLTKQHIIHRDLAARNCMLDEANVVVKITDFGLCRTSNIDYEYISENVAQQLPFRWTAIECFGTNRKFSEKSDVWSFGVVVWEIFARDLTPYAGRDSNGVREFLKAGNRLEFAHIPSCPQEIYERILLPCWVESPHNRPTFTELRGEIERSYWTLKNTSPEYLKTEYETPLSSIGSPTPTFADQ